MASACLTPRAPPTATTVFIYDAYTLRRTVVRALGHAAARKYDRYFAIAENPILINALLRKNAALDPDYATGFLQRELRRGREAVTQDVAGSFAELADELEEERARRLQVTD